MNNLGLVKFEKIHHNLEACYNKIHSAISHIDHFFHDMIDYNMLSKDSKNFAKTQKYFNIKTEVQQILRIHKD